MAENFFNAAERMRDSARVLHDSSQWHNACYLAGYVAECYFKIFLQFGIVSGSPRSYSHNFQRLSVDLIYAATSSATAAAYRPYLLNVNIECPNISSNWIPGGRYFDTASEWGEILSNSFQVEKEKCFEMITKMVIDGHI
ncbi:hypothetical protein [Mucilaginibacter celer]|nr:hypothetical protein [Mucilaginibacter celer]